MTNQGLYGALEQYWTVEEKPRLHRRNTYFDDIAYVSNWDALKFCIAFAVIGILIMTFWAVGVIL